MGGEGGSVQANKLKSRTLSLKARLKIPLEMAFEPQNNAFKSNGPTKTFCGQAADVYARLLK